MAAELGKLIDELSMRMRLFRAGQEDAAQMEDLCERDILLLELLSSRGRMAVSEIAAACSNVGESTISMNITKLWRNMKLVSKTINPDNQRVTFVEITQKGKELLKVIRQLRSERLAALFQAMTFADGEREILERVIARAIAYFDKHLGLRKNS
jgi:DNA-binding MarR family transcriptional regulator